MKKTINRGLKTIKDVTKAKLEQYNVQQFRLKYWSEKDDIFNPSY